MDDSRSKKKVCLDANSDFISHLPENVTDEILVRLPIGDAVRTSVLSTKWRYKWTTMTQLVFHDELILPSSPHVDKDKLINFIDRVFLLHSGYIHKFELSTRCLPIGYTIDSWILFLSRKNTIKELVLNFSHQRGKLYKLPTCFFSVQQISTLELGGCVLKPPPATFTGFSNLKSLYLSGTTFVDKGGGFECLISKCPLLERLTWITFSHTVRINICSPNLKYFRFLHGSFEDICFENTPLLSDVSIQTGYLGHAKLNKFLQSETGNVVKVLSSLPNLRKFDAGFDFLKFLTMGKIPKKLPFTCYQLNNLSLELNMKSVDAICVTLCLLNSSPNLQQLEIESGYPFDKSGRDIENFWEERTLIHWNMSRLQIVKITKFKGIELGLEFIKLLLSNSPMLEMLIIRSDKLDSDRKGLEFLKELLTFPRASPKARIKFLEQNEK